MKRYFLFYFILLLFFFINKNFSFLGILKVAKATYLNTSVKVYICGNGIIEGDEFCDDGTKNGTYGPSKNEKYCNTTCSGWAPYCGDNIKQETYGEECDDGNNINGDGCSAICTSEIPPSTTTTIYTPPGGGGGGSYIPPETKVNFTGKAYPKSTVTLLKDAQIVATTIAGADANFQISLSNITAGSYIFSIYSEDEKGNRSSLLTFPLSVTQGVTTNVTGIFIAPTIDVDKAEVKKGEVLKIFGQSAPNSEITIIINSEEEIYGKTKADKIGAYLYNLDTLELEKGDHLAKSRATSENDISPLSKAVNFKVGDKTVLKTKTGRCGKADLNCDGRVNLVDFSIAAYWYKRTLSSEFKTIENERLNSDNRIDLIDFSILAYYWTG